MATRTGKCTKEGTVTKAEEVEVISGYDDGSDDEDSSGYDDGSDGEDGEEQSDGGATTLTLASRRPNASGSAKARKLGPAPEQSHDELKAKGAAKAKGAKWKAPIGDHAKFLKAKDELKAGCAELVKQHTSRTSTLNKLEKSAEKLKSMPDLPKSIPAVLGELKDTQILAAVASTKSNNVAPEEGELALAKSEFERAKEEFIAAETEGTNILQSLEMIDFKFSQAERSDYHTCRHEHAEV